MDELKQRLLNFITNADQNTESYQKAVDLLGQYQKWNNDKELIQANIAGIEQKILQLFTPQE